MSLLYKSIVSVGDRIVPQALQPLWQHPAGNDSWNNFFHMICVVLRTLNTVPLNLFIQIVLQPVPLYFRSKNCVFLGASFQMGKCELIACRIKLRF